MNKLFFLFAIVAVSLYGCADTPTEEHHHTDAITEVHDHDADHDHDAADHDHAAADHDHDAEEVHDHEGHSHEGAITFTEEQQERVDFATAKCVVQPLGQVIKTTARITSSSNNEYQVTAKASGVVAFRDGTIVEGVKVSKGQVLFYIEGGDITDNNISIKYLQAENEYLRAKSEYERKQALSSEKIVSDSELLTAKTEYSNAKAVYNNFKKEFSNGRQAVVAPTTGYIKHIAVTNGEYVSAGTLLTSMVNNNSLYIRAEVPLRYASQLDGIKTANFRMLNSNTTYTLEELGGRLLSYGKSIDADHPLLPVTFEVEGKEGLLPGSFVETFIITQGEGESITVPNEAIVEEMGAYFVFVMLHDDMFSKVAISKGVTDGLSTAVTSGLTGKETVVSRGAIFVKLAQGTGTLDAHAGHVH